MGSFSRMAATVMLLSPLSALSSMACNSSHWVEPRVVQSPDGTASWYEIECGRRHVVCTTIAEHFCKNGYDVVGSYRLGPAESESYATSGGPNAGLGGAAGPSRYPYAGGGFSTPQTDNEDQLLVQCRPPATDPSEAPAPAPTPAPSPVPPPAPTPSPT